MNNRDYVLMIGLIACTVLTSFFLTFYGVNVVMSGAAPEVLVKSGEKTSALPVPAVEKVVGKVFQTLQCFGNAWPYFKCKACT